MSPSTRYGQEGFTIASAIFILVVLAGLAAAILTVSTGQQMSSTNDFLGSRAYWAARSAAEWGLKQTLLPDETAGARTVPTCMAVPQAVSLPGIAGLTVQITNCRRDGPFTDGGRTLYAYAVTANASTGTPVGSATHVEREVSVSAALCFDTAATLADGSTADPWQRCN